MTMNMIPAEFQGVKLDIIDHQGKRWLTAEQIGLALGYSEANASQGVRNLHNRHADEFSDADTCQLKLIWQGQGRDVRVFSDTGCILLGMFASTPRAKAFRLWAKETLAGLQPAAVATARPIGRPAVRVTRALERQVLELFVQGLSQKELARAAGVSLSAVNLLIHGKYRFAPGLGPSQCPPDLISEVTARHMQIEADRLVRAQDRIAQKFLASGCNHELLESLEYVGQCALDGSLVELGSGAA